MGVIWFLLGAVAAAARTGATSPSRSAPPVCSWSPPERLLLRWGAVGLGLSVLYCLRECTYLWVTLLGLG